MNRGYKMVDNYSKLLQEKLHEINAIRSRMTNYDWDYRLKRFEEKIQYESLEVKDKLKNIKKFDK